MRYFDIFQTLRQLLFPDTIGRVVQKKFFQSFVVEQFDTSSFCKFSFFKGPNPRNS